jgi:FixJ family two-component response regulator
MPKALLVAVVEDDQFFRESMRCLLRSLGSAVQAFPSVADFLASPRLGETACLIADLHMPDSSSTDASSISGARSDHPCDCLPR